MLAQFQSLYPQGSLISELVQIDHGKYIVRASVQIEGVTRATGLAAAETLEEAEDRARSRALMVLGITSTTQDSAPSSTQPIMQTQANSTRVKTPVLSEASVYPSTINFPKTEAIALTPPLTPTDDAYTHDVEQQVAGTSNQEPKLDKRVENEGTLFDTLPPEESHPLPSASTSNVTPFTPRSYSSSEEIQTKPTPTTEKKRKRSEPVDLSDVIAKTDVHIERLGWTKEQGRDHLKKKYGKIGRTLLNEEELLDFLKYLESQPTPLDPLAGF
jgi:hypothetical protein